ncbi:hypothetical protein [Prosthecochloris sp. ZM_2]|nr:hypothetical protein [Prosthecochloris sp. ZM_2]
MPPFSRHWSLVTDHCAIRRQSMYSVGKPTIERVSAADPYGRTGRNP